MHALRCAQDAAALEKHKGFLDDMAQLDKDILRRNATDSKTRTVFESHALEYTLLRPHSEPGVTFQGVPCSTSI
jgi:hypothetical protein